VLQAKGGTHLVIPPGMCTYFPLALLSSVLGTVLRTPGAQDPATARVPDNSALPTLHEMLAPIGINFSKAAPANVSLIVALLACLAVYILIWRTPLGLEIRSFGKSPRAARYGGIGAVRITMIAMLISGALAGMMAINNVMGEAERLVLNAVENAGFIGIAVALMGRSHPFGIVLAGLLFGFLYQGGAELALWMSIPTQLITVIQALVILFTGALDNMVRMPLEKVFLAARRPAKPRAQSPAE